MLKRNQLLSAIERVPHSFSLLTHTTPPPPPPRPQMTRPSTLATKCLCGYDAVISEVKNSTKNRGRWYWRVSGSVHVAADAGTL